MNRREALRRVALLTGAAVSMPLAAALLQGCESGASTAAEGLKYMTQLQFDVLNELAERIMPKTDTPGAKDAGVANFIDTMLAEYYTEEEAKGFITGLDAFEEDCKAANGKSFTEMSDEDRDAHLTKVEDAAHKIKEKATEDDKEIFWFTAKQGILAAFFISEVGATKVLQHKAIPGPFKGCVPLAEAGEGKTWASDWGL